MEAKDCAHEIISTYEPIATGDGWDFSRWRAVCFECKREGILDESTATFTPDVNADLYDAVDAAFQARAFTTVKAPDGGWKKNTVLDAIEAGDADGFRMSDNVISAFVLDDRKLGVSLAKATLAGLTREEDGEMSGD